jgi:TetR/AcrR family transcriptional regulator, transcriptional repressor for nem operon
VPRRPNQSNSPSRILDVAERLVQTRGFNGFSYADVASELGVTAPSLHYHFRGKAELGEALVRRYRTRFGAALDAVDAERRSSAERLDAYASIYADVLRVGRMCLCGMLAAGYDTLPAGMRTELVQFFDENERWLTVVLENGRAQQELRFDGEASVVARSIISGLEGAMLIARPYGDVARFESAARALLRAVAPIDAPSSGSGVRRKRRAT